ncbi:hypothetical protein BDN67DRAFT_986230, partial [Paxillus ammoniavirescens]
MLLMVRLMASSHVSANLLMEVQPLSSHLLLVVCQTKMMTFCKICGSWGDSKSPSSKSNSDEGEGGVLFTPNHDVDLVQVTPPSRDTAKASVVPAPLDRNAKKKKKMGNGSLSLANAAGDAGGPTIEGTPSAHLSQLGENNWPPRTRVVVKGDGTIGLKSQPSHIQDILHESINVMERLATLLTYYPSMKEKREMEWDAVFEAAESLQYPEICEWMRQDSTYARTLGSICRNRINGFHNSIKEVADHVVAGVYSVRRGDDVKIDHLLHMSNFVYVLDNKDNTILNKPFLNLGIINILREAFFAHPDGPRFQFKSYFTSVLDDNDEPELPIAMVAGAVTAAHSSPLDMKTEIPSGHKRGDFGVNAFMGLFNHYVSMLNRIYMEGDCSYHALMVKLYKQASGGDTNSNASSAMQQAAIMCIDFAGMEKLRRELKVWDRLQHDNIVQLLGVVSGFRPLSSMVCPWFSNGALSSYLPNHEGMVLSGRQGLLSNIASGLCC